MVMDFRRSWSDEDLELFRDKRAWHAMMRRGMALDHTWAQSAERYRALYGALVER